MQTIISAQHGKHPHIKSEELELADHSKDILVQQTGTVKDIDMKALNLLARTLGAPLDLKAGVFLHHKLGAQVKK